MKTNGSSFSLLPVDQVPSSSARIEFDAASMADALARAEKLVQSDGTFLLERNGIQIARLSYKGEGFWKVTPNLAH